VEARAWLLLDFNSGQVLASQNANDRFEPASLTKLMTAYLAYQRTETENAQTRPGDSGFNPRLEIRRLTHVHRTEQAGDC